MIFSNLLSRSRNFSSKIITESATLKNKIIENLQCFKETYSFVLSLLAPTGAVVGTMIGFVIPIFALSREKIKFTGGEYSPPTGFSSLPLFILLPSMGAFIGGWLGYWYVFTLPISVPFTVWLSKNWNGKS